MNQLSLGSWTETYDIYKSAKLSDGRGGFQVDRVILYPYVPGRITALRPPREGFQGSAIKSSRWALIELDSFYCETLLAEHYIKDVTGSMWMIDTIQKEGRLFLVRVYL